jgi:hypothetical protein
MTRYTVALTEANHKSLTDHLLARRGNEDLCFALWHPSSGAERMSALLDEIILPLSGDRERHGASISFLPQYLDRVVDIARSAGAGIAFLHSHLGPGWQNMSSDDVAAEQRLAPRVLAATGLSLVGLTLGTDGSWSARFWEKTAPKTFERRWCERVRVVGEALSITYNDQLVPPPMNREELERTTSAWGEKVQADLSRLVVGVVGLGSVGGIVAEGLARMGVRELCLIDFDSVERVNLDRLLHATSRDIGEAKVRVMGRELFHSATAAAFCARQIEFSVVEDKGYRAALDCDVIFSCVDRPWGRHVLNSIAFAHLIPVIDGGIRAEAMKNGSGLKRVDVRAHAVTCTRECLECIGQYDSGLVSLERDGFLDDEGYIVGLSRTDPMRANENVFSFSLQAAGFQIAQLISLFVKPLGRNNPGATIYHLVSNSLETTRGRCRQLCLFPSLTAKGDHSKVRFAGEHRIAQAHRQARRERQLDLAPREPKGGIAGAFRRLRLMIRSVR